MVNGDRGGTGMGVDVGIGPAIAPRRNLLCGEWGQGRNPPKSPYATEMAKR